MTKEELEERITKLPEGVFRLVLSPEEFKDAEEIAALANKYKYECLLCDSQALKEGFINFLYKGATICLAK